MLSSFVASKLKKIILFALCLSLCGLPLCPAYAREKKQKVVRVGWYESAFHSTDQFGRRSGYGYEYQQRVATFTGWTYEYVEGSWSELFEMLVAGEIDLLSDVSYTEIRAQAILYSAEAMGSEDYHAFIAPNNTDIRPDDFSTFDGKRVGVNKNSIQEQLFMEWTQKHDVSPEIVELTGKTPELLAMLDRGEIDVLVTLDTYGNTADIIPVCKIGSADSYFGISRRRPDLKQELDAAMNRLLEDNRNLNQEMTEKYNRASGISSFLTADEMDWLSAHGVIRVGYRDNFLPFCAMDGDTQSLTGALVDYLSFARTCEKNAELNFEATAYSTTEAAMEALAKGEIDCVFPISLSAYDGEQLGVIITDSLITTEMYAAVRTADHRGISRDRDIAVAVIRGLPSYETFLMDHFPDWRMVYFGDIVESFQAVASGSADCVLVNNYRLARMNDLCAKYKLSTLATGETMDMSFAVRREDDCLYSIIGKINRLIPAASLNAALTNYAFVTEKVTFRQFLRDNLSAVVAGVAIIASVILLLLLWSVRAEMKSTKDRKLISEAERDRLTQLYNRDFFLIYANRLYKEHPEKPMDAIVMNIDRFHNLNTLNGRSFGDMVLRTLGGEIEAFLKETEGIGSRMDGDNFNIYCAHREDYAALLKRFQSRMNAAVRGADIRLRMGVTPWQKNTAPEQLFDHAWSACSMVRGNYKTRLMVYDEELRRRDEYNQRLLNDLGRALEEKELEVYYQPKYDIRSEPPRLNSAEALIRWRHPELGMISPEDFIFLFERSGHITAVDNFVWREAARQIAAWREQYGFTLPVSVNLSRVDVFDHNLSATLDGLVAEHGLSRGDLQLEITESAYTENADQLIRIIQQLRQKGYEIEMDDFGSGYSSLNMISSMPIDVLKMDMGFIKNIGHNAKDFRLVEIVIDIAKFLKVPVIAEGVETEKQLKLLRAADCDLVQGYYFSRPLPPEEFGKLIEKEMKKIDR